MPRHRRPAHPAVRTAARTAWVTAATAALAAGSLAGPSGPATALPLKQPTTLQTWFSCPADPAGKVGNAQPAAGWDTSAPTASVQSGAGCGQADIANTNVTAGSVAVSTFRATGTFTGLLRDLTVRLDDIYVGQGRAGGNQVLRVWLKVDGVDRLINAAVTVDPKPSSTGASEAFVFSVGDLGLTRDEVDEGPHTVELLVEGSQTLNAWVYDTVEVPSGIVFNPAQLEPAPAVPNPV